MARLLVFRLCLVQVVIEHFYCFMRFFFFFWSVLICHTCLCLFYFLGTSSYSDGSCKSTDDSKSCGSVASELFEILKPIEDAVDDLVSDPTFTAKLNGAVGGS